MSRLLRFVVFLEPLVVLIKLVYQAIEVPETLLKKRKQNEKAREERLAAAVAARKVSISVCVCDCTCTLLGL